jgi:hypothetical protein
MKNAYFLSHNGLGDNITNIGAIEFLLKFYDTIYFLCKDKYEENVKLLFSGKRVVTVPFNHRIERPHCKHILSAVDTTKNDIFISGFCHTSYLKSHITEPALLAYGKNNKYSLKYDHIVQFYNDIGLDTSVYVDYFDIASNELTQKYYDDIKQYKIIFLHTQGSNRNLNLSPLIHKYKDNKDYIMICADKNVYDPTHPYYAIADPYTKIKVAHYIDIIKNADLIHIINSCFSCIVYPLLLSNRITPTECVIYDV